MKFEQNVRRLIVRVVFHAEVSVVMRNRVCALLLLLNCELALQITYLFLVLFCSLQFNVRYVQPGKLALLRHTIGSFLVDFVR